MDVGPHLGTYERASVLGWRCSPARTAPVLRTTVTGPLAELVPDPTHEYPMVAVAEDLFVVRDPDARRPGRR